MCKTKMFERGIAFLFLNIIKKLVASATHAVAIHIFRFHIEIVIILKNLAI